MFVLFVLHFAFAVAAADRVRLVIDTDGAADDVMAISLAVQSPEVEVVAFTTVDGGTTAIQTVANVVRTLKANNVTRQIPIYKGAQNPLIGGIDTKNDSRAFFGSDGLSDLPQNFPQFQPSFLEHYDHSTPAANALIRLFRSQPQQLTLVAIGPLTNLALALKLEPEFSKWPKRLILTGGNVFGKGNVRRSSTAEFNFNTDPEAAHIVLREMNCPITVVTWESMFHFQDERKLSFDFNRHFQIHSPLADYFRTVSTLPRQAMHLASLPYRYCDEITMGIAIEPKRIVSQSTNLSVVVELHGTFTRGQLAVGWADESFGKADDWPMRNVELIMDYDVDQLDNMIIEALQRSTIEQNSSRNRFSFNPFVSQFPWNRQSNRVF
ncbi:Uridine nucleosidase 1 [Aphelenchoides besseyi]|nr:Uridine nucleosidase 1 [Aphelenchoides besseyi]